MTFGAVDVMDEVFHRLDSLGYSPVPEDTRTIDYLLEKISNKVKLNTNRTELPDELLQMVIDMVCGEFLQAKYATGKLTGFDFSGSVKRISEGDTTVEYAYGSGSKTPEERFVAYLKVLREPNRDMLAAVRRLRW